MQEIKLMSGAKIPLELHRTRIVQNLSLLPIEERLQKIEAAGHNLYLLHNKDIFLDMLTDSGVNAMSDNQLAAMMNADDAYAGSESFYKLADKIKQLFGMEHFLPAYQGRACEKLLADWLVGEGDVIPMNYHFTTTKAHISRCGGSVIELIHEEGLDPEFLGDFKGNMDIERLRNAFETFADKIPFVRMEAGTNLIGGQPFALENLRQVAKLCQEFDKLLILDASLLQDNLYFIKTREKECKDLSIKEITREIADACDIIYFSARKFGFARGGGIALRYEKLKHQLEELVVLNEGFLTYGGMSIKEVAAIEVGLDETMEFSVISQGPQFIEHMVNKLDSLGVPVVKPAGGLGVHLNASKFLETMPKEQYPAAALASALYIVSGIRAMERGTLSEERNTDGSEKFADMELLRLAMPRRVFTLSQIEYAVDRVKWLYDNRDLISGLRFKREPKILRFFAGELEPINDWPEKLLEKFRADFGESL